MRPLSKAVASIRPPTRRFGGRIDAAAFDRGLIVLSTQPTRDGYAGDQTLFAPAFTSTDDELAEMVARFHDVVLQVADEVEPALTRSEPSSTTPIGGSR